MKITTRKQFEQLIAELEKNPEQAKGFHRGTAPSNFKEDWEVIASKLNSIGPPIRDSEGWQKVWRDFKCKVKKKLVHNKAEVKATGGGTYKQLSLSKLEEAAANLMQFQKQLNPEGVAQGAQSLINELLEENDLVLERETFEDDENLQPIPSNVVQMKERPASSARKRKESHKIFDKNEFFQNYHEMEKESFTEMCKIMKSMKDSLKESSRYQRKLWEVEEKKIKMIERREQREEQLFQAEMELKNIKIEIKKKEMEVLQNKKEISQNQSSIKKKSSFHKVIKSGHGVTEDSPSQ